MTDLVHKFKIGQTVDLIPSMGRSAGIGDDEIVSSASGRRRQPAVSYQEQK